MVDLYDNLAGTYDMLISWTRRLKRERPFFAHVFKEYGVKRILDTACGTGKHAIAFHDWGFYVVGTDISLPMVEKSRENAGDRNIEFVHAGFTESDDIGMFDAVTCLGNSLPHVLSDEDLDRSLSSMFNALLPGGILILHQNNYDRILAMKERFMPLAEGRQGGKDHLFLRFFDFHDDLLTFNVVTLRKENGSWSMFPDSSTHKALTKKFMVERLEKAGFHVRHVYGGYPNEPFDEMESDNLIVVAQRPHNEASRPRPEPIRAINRVPIRDNGEPLVEATSAIPGILKADRPVYGRKTVIEMLAKAQSLLPEGYTLKLRTVYRTHQFQATSYWELYDRLVEQHPEWPTSQVRREINKFLAPPDAKHPPGHTTGGAVDLLIVCPDGTDMDTYSTIRDVDNQWPVFPTYSKLITPRAAKNRQMLMDIMLQAGFSNYPGEWWHYSYGDSAWAVRVGAPFAIYGAANPELPDDVLEELNKPRAWK